ncbi:MAG: hypothetical protein ACRELA_02255, partial [Candidatus Rokuibacteriota bacterium]
MTCGQEGKTPPVWPYPLLCLAWRLGWGGRRVIDRGESDGPGSVLRAVARGIEWPAAGAPERSADHEPAGALIAPDANATDDVDAPEGASTTLDRVTTILHRSPLAGLIAVPDRPAAVVTDTARLIRPELPASHDVPVPPFWRPALAAWPGWHELRSVPRPRPRWDPATWTLVGVLEGAWEATGTTFLGRERPVLFQVAGTRRMAARHGWSTRR